MKKDPAEINWDWSKVDPDKPGVYEVTGKVGEASTTVKVTVRSNKELAALTKQQY